MPRLNPLLWPKSPVIWAYGIAVVSVAAAMIALQWPPLHLQQAPASLFLCAILLSAWFGGTRPGLLATALSALAYYYVLPPTDSLGPKPAEIPRLVVFTATALFVWLLGATQRSATESLRGARDELKVTVQELQSANETLQTESHERKSAEESLRRSEGYLAEAQRLSHTGSWASIPAKGEISYLSEECYRVMGFDPHGGQPRYEAFFERIHPDDQAKVREAVETAACENTDFKLDYRMIHPGGEIRDIHVVGHPVPGATGDFVEFVGTMIDITERKRADDRTRLIIDTVPAQIWTESPEGVVDFVNRRWIDYTGMTLEQAVGSGWNRMVHPDDIEGVLSKWRILVSEGKPREIESRLRRSDGEYRWFLSRCYPLVDRSGNILGWYGSDTDIHDRKVAEETLRRSEGYLAEAQRLSHTGSWASKPATDENTYWSEECYRLMGFDPHGGQPGFDTSLQRYHPDDQARVREAVEKAEREKGGFELDYRIIHPGGEIRDIHVIGHPVLSPSGDFAEFVGTVMDITERKQAEEERERLRQAQADLARVNRMTTMGELTASLAHEINQPIAATVTSANSCIRWLAGELPNLDKARAAAARIVKDGTRAAEIISRLRVLFQKGSPQLELVDVNEVIEEMVVLLRGEAAQYSISLRTELAADLPQVMGDRVQLQQVMMNLMLNGIDATKGVEGTRELAIESQQVENGQLQVSVRDSGVGLPRDQMDQIFDAFFTTKPHGTGMGLRICRSIVESHGGRLWAANNPERGASFYFALSTKVEARE
jgi:PAS domain S-box-containing protein